MNKKIIEAIAILFLISGYFFVSQLRALAMGQEFDFIYVIIPFIVNVGLGLILFSVYLKRKKKTKNEE